jgi:hypothetical protein
VARDATERRAARRLLPRPPAAALVGRGPRPAALQFRW